MASQSFTADGIDQLYVIPVNNEVNFVTVDGVGVAFTESAVGSGKVFLRDNPASGKVVVINYTDMAGSVTANISGGAIDGATVGATTPATGAFTAATVGGGTAITKIAVYAPSIDVASVAAATTAEQTFAVAGLTTADKVFVNKPTVTAGLGIANARVSAADTLAITFVNATAAAIDPAVEVYAVIAVRS